MSRQCFSTLGGRLFLAWLVLASTLAPASAAELNLEAKLIWATDDDKSPDPNHKPVDPATAEKLRKVFKWKNYFVVNKVAKVVPSRGTSQFVLSKDCTVEIKELEGPRVEVTLIGKGKQVHKTTKTLNKGEWFTYAGDDKNQSAWFVIVAELDEK